MRSITGLEQRQQLFLLPPHPPHRPRTGVNIPVWDTKKVQLARSQRMEELVPKLSLQSLGRACAPDPRKICGCAPPLASYRGLRGPVASLGKETERALVLPHPRGTCCPRFPGA
jgi:hypothetical protein